MGEVVLYIAASLDGYIAREDGDVSWLEPFEAGGEDYGYEELLKRIWAIVMGGSTYRQVLEAGEWPYKGLETYVLTRQSLPQPPDGAAHAYSGSIKELVQKLKAESDRDIWLVGGAQTLRQFRQEQLIDEFIITVIPVLLGDGIPLFRPTIGPDRGVELLNADVYPNGVVQLRYACCSS